MYFHKCKFCFILGRIIFTDVKSFNVFSQTYFDGRRIYNTFAHYVNGGVRTDFCKTAEDVLNQ